MFRVCLARLIPLLIVVSVMSRYRANVALQQIYVTVFLQNAKPGAACCRNWRVEFTGTNAYLGTSNPIR